MKKSITLVLSLALLLCLFPVQAGAATQNSKTTEVILNSDGSRLVITTEILPSETRGTITGSKTMSSVETNGNVSWSATLVGSFTYNGITSACTSASLSFSASSSDWSLVSSSTSLSGNTGRADFSVAHKLLGITISTRSYTFSISCDKDGNLS